MARTPALSAFDAEAAAVAVYGDRGTGSAMNIMSDNRGPVRAWLTACGISSETARNMSLQDLRLAWSNPTNGFATIAPINTTQDEPTVSNLALTLRRPTAFDAAETRRADDTAAFDAARAVKPAAGSQDLAADLAAVMARMMAAQAQSAPIDADQVRAIVAEAIEGLTAPRPLSITINEREPVNVGVQHAQFDDLLLMCAARVNVWLAGPAGSGKTTAAKNVAAALALPFHFTGAVDTEYKLLGFTDAGGRIVRRAFREAWEHGGVFLFDEIDASLPGAVLALNAALAGDLADFPDGVIAKHPDCIIIAAANTWGLGANSDYVGRMKQDAAFLDRFARLDWQYDAALETATSGNAPWCAFVQEARANAKAKGLKVIISPRATYRGAALLAAGMAWDKVARACIADSITADQWSAIQPVSGHAEIFARAARARAA